MPSLNLFTSGPMVNLSITTIEAAGGAEAAGFPIENAFDHNPDTFWKASTVDGATIDIDLGAAYTVDSFTFWLHNWEEYSFDAGHDVRLRYGTTDDGNFTTVTTLASLFPGIGSDAGAATMPLANSGEQSEVSKRFWRIEYNGNDISTVAEFSGFWLHRTRTISKSSQLPRNDTIRYANRVSQAAGGREFYRGVNSNAVDVLPRTYLIEETDWTALKGAFDDSRGRRLPMIYSESGEDERLVRFASDTLSQNEISHQMYNPTFTLMELPFVPDGQTF